MEAQQWAIVTVLPTGGDAADFDVASIEESN